MKYHRLTLAAAALASRSRAYTHGTGGSFLGRSLHFNNPAPKNINHHGMTMFFSNFLGGSGAYGQQIPYETLDHPGPELAQLAQAGKVSATSPSDPQYSLATFAGGCFWGLELAYQRVPGVVYTVAGYTQGVETNPTYNQVCAGATGHTEAIMVYYDNSSCVYETLLDTFFARVDITTPNGQGMDRGKQYRTGIYYHTPQQEETARARIAQEASSAKYSGGRQRPVGTEVKAATPFWPAEKTHQQYLEKGGRFGSPQDASKGATDEIRCYG